MNSAWHQHDHFPSEWPENWPEVGAKGPVKDNCGLQKAAPGMLREDGSCRDTQLLFRRWPLRARLPSPVLKGSTSHCPFARILTQPRMAATDAEPCWYQGSLPFPFCRDPSRKTQAKMTGRLNTSQATQSVLQALPTYGPFNLALRPVAAEKQGGSTLIFFPIGRILCKAFHSMEQRFSWSLHWLMNADEITGIWFKIEKTPMPCFFHFFTKTSCNLLL